MFVARNAAALKKIRPGQDMLGDFTPVRLPNAAFGEQPRMAAKKIIGGDGHADVLSSFPLRTMDGLPFSFSSQPIQRLSYRCSLSKSSSINEEK
jgi:hypothetical protein